MITTKASIRCPRELVIAAEAAGLDMADVMLHAYLEVITEPGFQSEDEFDDNADFDQKVAREAWAYYHSQVALAGADEHDDSLPF